MQKSTIIILSLVLFACDNSESQQKIERVRNNQAVKDTAEVDIIEGYQPSQPIDFSHSIRAGENGIDCRYCHKSPRSNEKITPSHSICLECHKVNTGDLSSGAERDLIKQISDSIKIKQNGIVWKKVHSLPDSVYFSNQFK